MSGVTQECILAEKEGKTFRLAVKGALRAYEEVDAKLRDRIFEYLVGGEDAGCILELAAALQDDNRKKFFKEQYGNYRAQDRVQRKKLFGLFQIDKATPGYYRRLGEIAGQIPEVAKTQFDADDRYPKWFADVMALRRMLSTDHFYYSYGEDQLDSAYRLLPYAADLQDEFPVDELIALTVAADWNAYHHISRYLRIAGDWADLLQEHPQALSSALLSADALAREGTLNQLIAREFDFSDVLPCITKLAVSSSKKVRPLALNVLRKSPERAGQLLAGELSRGTARERANAAEAMVAILGPRAESDLQTALENEKGKRVRQTIESLLVGIQAGAEAQQAEQADLGIELPAIEIPSGPLPLPDGFAQQLREYLEAGFAKLEKQYRKQLDAYNAPDKPSWLRKPQKPSRIKDKEFAKIIDFIECKTDKAPGGSHWTRVAALAMPVWSQWADLRQLHLVHVVRFMEAFQLLNQYRGEDQVYFNNEEWLESHRSAQEQPYGLREVDAAVATLPRFNSGAIARSYLQSNNSWRNFLDWEPDAVWPVFAEQIELFRDNILGVSTGHNDYWASERRRTAMRVAAMLPKLPREIENAMWSVALGEGKSDRPAARRALHAAENRLPRAVAAISDGKQGIRIAGAEMLGEMGDPSAIEPLKKALQKEKQEIVKGAMLQAIEKLGGDVDEFLGRRKQLLDAKKGLEKKRPKGMEWVPLDSLPTVRWAEDDKPVAKEILQWWVVQSIQFKLPTCGAVLRRSVAMCRPDDVAALAQQLLADWIAYDTKTPAREDVIAAATSIASQHWSSGRSKWLKEYYKTEENYRDQLANQMQGEFLQSAIGQKGLLAIVAAGGDAHCVKMIERYIRTYHGHRLAQSKALLETLGWIDDPGAIQLLLSLANRFRTKAIRKRAEEMVQELADRQGWTMDQLADRTIPDAGFARERDDDGNPIGDRDELVLDYGSRTFSVILGDDLQAVITRDDGKQVKSLPPAAKNDDPELVKAAKKEFSAAKKTVKEVVKSQAERLYEATCTQRCWPASEWRQYLAQHPIAGALCRRVVWAARPREDATEMTLFRPLEDGSLTDVNDDEFTLDDPAWVCVAHSSLLDEQTEQAWKQHLQDYEVPELFQQFGRETYRLPEAKSRETEITDFQGHMLTTFRLRSRATKLGWVRGDAEDGGCFAIYRKPFRSQHVEAVVEFTGSYLPEEDIPAAIRELYFVPIKPNDEAVYSWSPNKIKLEKVPPVLLSECYNDVREMAAEGSGFDPEWEKRGLW